jgi:hypothetical protein
MRTLTSGLRWPRLCLWWRRSTHQRVEAWFLSISDQDAFRASVSTEVRDWGAVLELWSEDWPLDPVYVDCICFLGSKLVNEASVLVIPCLKGLSYVNSPSILSVTLFIDEWKKPARSSMFPYANISAWLEKNSSSLGENLQGLDGWFVDEQCESMSV